jgi:diguanylate cyclase (GGDEF)-like protein
MMMSQVSANNEPGELSPPCDEPDASQPSPTDLQTLLQLAQSIAQEIQFEQLLQVLMQVFMTYACADRGVLLLNSCQQMGTLWAIGAMANTAQSIVILQPMPPLAGSDPLPMSLIDYVTRARKALLLNEATVSEVRSRVAQERAIADLDGDPYWQQYQPAMALGLPILNQGELIGLIYLESHQLGQRLDPERFVMLRWLCTQAAISLENARLYQHSQTYAQRLELAQDELVKAQQELLYASSHDALTGLYNRSWFMHRLKRLMEKAQDQTQPSYAVLLLDLDRFKVINDSLGHMLGDELLRHVARRLQLLVTPPHVNVARLGGDEFGVLIETQASTDRAVAFASEIQQHLSRPFKLTTQAEDVPAVPLNLLEIYTGVSIGIALSPIPESVAGGTLAQPLRQYQRPEDILRDADTALYQVKAQGRNGYAVFNASLQMGAMERLQIETDLRRLVDACQHTMEVGEILLHYQPIVDLVSGDIHGFEALARWHHPQLGWISPQKFIGIAEETGLINVLGHWLLLSACRQLRQWQNLLGGSDTLGRKISLAVNCSVIQLQQSDFLDKLDSILEKTQITPHSLKLEITESCLFDPNRDNLSVIDAIRERGIELCIDDFGTGYSSLSRFNQLPMDVLKIDYTFTKLLQAPADPQQVEMVAAIVKLAKGRGLKTVAEGIETSVQMQSLKAMGCDYGQGYLFYRPLDSQSAGDLLQRRLSAAA